MHLFYNGRSDWLNHMTHLTQVATMSIPGSILVLHSTFKHDASARLESRWMINARQIQSASEIVHMHMANQYLDIALPLSSIPPFVGTI